MAQRLRYFLVVLLLMFAEKNFAQEISSGKTCETVYIRCGTLYLNQHPPYKLRLKTDSLLNKTNSETLFKKQKPSPWYFTRSTLSESFIVLSAEKNVLKNQYTSSIGVMCKGENKFEKTTSIPLRLRIGSLDYTNYLEQKPNAVKPAY